MLKRKHKNTPRKAPKNLWFQRSFEFVSPHSLEDCCSLLEEFDDDFFSGYRSIYLSSVDQKQIAFHISKSAGKSGKVWAVGYLQAEADQSTRIVGKSGIPAYDLVLTVFMFGIAALILELNAAVDVGLRSFCFIGFGVVFIGIIIGGGFKYSLDGLINDLKWFGQRIE